MRKKRDSAILEWAARRAEGYSFFLGSDLAQFQAFHNMDDAQLAEFLGCAEPELRDLALCRRPDPSAPTFKEDVERVASYLGVKIIRLAELIRQVDALTALNKSANPEGTLGFLIAARDRLQRTEKKEPPEKDDAGPES